MSSTKGFTRLTLLLSILLLVILFSAVVWYLIKQPSTENQVNYQPPAPVDYLTPKGVPKVAAVEAVSAKTALTLAMPVAATWQKDAKPISIKSGSDVALDGRSMLWDVTFAVVTSKKKLEAYHVTVEGGQVKILEKVETADVLIVPLPDAWSDSKEAINRAIRVLKATELKVNHMEFFQNTGGNTWHWSLATDKGVVSMLATP